jgi:DNA polymerase-3 subunit delta'
MQTATKPAVQPVASASGWRVWGQDAAVQTLQRAARTRPRHAYVLAGPEHAGKLSLATEFALALNCPHAADGMPCLSCATCRRIERGVHPDVSIFDLARQASVEGTKGKNTTLTIDTVRAIGQELALRPAEAPWRVLVVDDMETMQETAQEAFLKTLEEPPAAAVLLLLTNDVENLLETVLSRCVLLTVPTVGTEVIDEALRTSGVPPDAAAELAGLAQGLPGWAFAAANNEELRLARRDQRDEARAWIAGDAYDRTVRAIRIADRYGQDRDQVIASLVAVMLEWRELLLQSVGLGNGDTGRGAAGPSAYTTPDLARAISSVRACLADLDTNVRPRLACESMVMLWPNPR